MAVLVCLTTFIGIGATPAFAASETAESYMVSYPRDGDAVQVYDQSTWGHSAKTYMNGWYTGTSTMTTIHCMDSYDGKVCYCIEPGIERNVGDTYTKFDENFWEQLSQQPEQDLSLIQSASARTYYAVRISGKHLDFVEVAEFR